MDKKSTVGWSFYTAKECKPAGWLRRQLEIQAGGLNGHLDRVWPDVRDSGWIGGDREGWERVPYWLDGFIPLAYLLEDGDMIRRAGRYVDRILAAQQPDGWICPCKEEERRGYDLWAVLLLSKVLTVYYECSGDERAVEAAYRALNNLYRLLKSGEYRLFEWGKFRWFEGFVALNFLYGRYKEEWMRELASLLRDQGADYDQLKGLWRVPENRWQFETHIVNIAMMLKSEAVSCDLLGEPYADLAEERYRLLEEFNGTPVGVFTGDECLSGISPVQGTELCAVVEQMYSYELLYAYTGEEKWARRLELAAFNALPATLSEDMWTHQYLQQRNQIACILFPDKSPFRTNGPEANRFGLEPNFGCCTANFGQGWPKLALSAFMHKGDRVLNALMIPSRLRAPGIQVDLDTDYPFENRAVYRIRAERNFTFQVRVPSFAEDLRVNGEPAAPGMQFFFLRAGERREIRIEFTVSPRFEARPNGLATAVCGSLVFSVPIPAEWVMKEYERDGVERKFPYCDYELLPRGEWNYAYCSNDLTVRRQKVGEIPFSAAHPPVTLTAEVCRIDWGTAEGFDGVCAPRPRSTVPLSSPCKMTLLPYGCAKLRMTELPFADSDRVVP